MNRRQRIIVSVTGIFIVLLILIGLTYAYFLTRITGNGNPTSISVTTANLELVYGDGTTAILSSSNPIEPGKFSSSKDFTVTNNGNALTEYAVTLEDFSITYAADTVIDGVSIKAGTVTKMEYPDDMKMTITCTITSKDATRNGTSCRTVDSTLPTENSILLTNSIEVDDVHKYVLTLTYVDSGIDQSKDMNKTIKGKIDIIDPKSTIDLTGTVATYQTGDYVEINSTPVKSEIVDGKYKLIGVEPGSHTLYVKYKDSNGNVQTRGSQSLIIKKGEEASVSGNNIVFTNESRIAIIDINDSYELIIGEIVSSDIISNFNIIANGDFEPSPSIFYNPYRVANGKPEITESVFNTISASLKSFGNVSNNLVQNIEVSSGYYYVAANVRVDRYVQGSAGIVFSGNVMNWVDQRVIDIQKTTNNEFQTYSNIISIPKSGNLSVYIGSSGNADLDCYLDDIILIPMSLLKKDMSKGELDLLYDNYISSLKISELSLDYEYVSKFMEKANEKAFEIGMENSYFVEPSGCGTVSINKTTAKDVMKLIIIASKNEILNNIWKTETRNVNIYGSNSRIETIDSLTYNEGVATRYPFLGGKTGSWDNVYNVASITQINGNLVVGVILNADTDENRFIALNELYDISSNVISDENYDVDSAIVSKATSAISCIIRDDSYEILFEQNADTLYAPASITKVLTALTALDYINNINETLEIKLSDLIYDSRMSFRKFDIITYEDILYSMMLPSSNQAAQALARTIGESL